MIDFTNDRFGSDCVDFFHYKIVSFQVMFQGVRLLLSKLVNQCTRKYHLWLGPCRIFLARNSLGDWGSAAHGNWLVFDSTMVCLFFACVPGNGDTGD